MIETRKYLTKDEEEYLKISLKNQISSLQENLAKHEKIKEMENVSIVKEGECDVDE